MRPYHSCCCFHMQEKTPLPPRPTTREPNLVAACCHLVSGTAFAVPSPHSTHSLRPLTSRFAPLQDQADITGFPTGFQGCLIGRKGSSS